MEFKIYNPVTPNLHIKGYSSFTYSFGCESPIIGWCLPLVFYHILGEDLVVKCVQFEEIGPEDALKFSSVQQGAIFEVVEGLIWSSMKMGICGLAGVGLHHELVNLVEF